MFDDESNHDHNRLESESEELEDDGLDHFERIKAKSPKHTPIPVKVGADQKELKGAAAAKTTHAHRLDEYIKDRNTRNSRFHTLKDTLTRVLTSINVQCGREVVVCITPEYNKLTSAPPVEFYFPARNATKMNRKVVANNEQFHIGFKVNTRTGVMPEEESDVYLTPSETRLRLKQRCEETNDDNSPSQRRVLVASSSQSKISSPPPPVVGESQVPASHGKARPKRFLLPPSSLNLHNSVPKPLSPSDLEALPTPPPATGESRHFLQHRATLDRNRRPRTHLPQSSSIIQNLGFKPTSPSDMQDRTVAGGSQGRKARILMPTGPRYQDRQHTSSRLDGLPQQRTPPKKLKWVVSPNGMNIYQTDVNQQGAGDIMFHKSPSDNKRTEIENSESPSKISKVKSSHAVSSKVKEVMVPSTTCHKMFASSLDDNLESNCEEITAALDLSSAIGSSASLCGDNLASSNNLPIDEFNTQAKFDEYCNIARNLKDHETENYTLNETDLNYNESNLMDQNVIICIDQNNALVNDENSSPNIGKRKLALCTSSTENYPRPIKKRAVLTDYSKSTNPSPPNPIPINTTLAKPTPAKPTPAKPTASKPTPAKPSPTKLTPPKPTPTKPTPTPAKPTPTKPTPAKPTPTKPTPAKPTPSKPSPTKPTPAKPTPTKPTPAKPSPTKPSPTKPTPAKPTPTNHIPTPAKPTPTNPIPSPAKLTSANPTTINPTSAKPISKKNTAWRKSIVPVVTPTITVSNLPGSKQTDNAAPALDETKIGELNCRICYAEEKSEDDRAYRRDKNDKLVKTGLQHEWITCETPGGGCKYWAHCSCLYEKGLIKKQVKSNADLTKLKFFCPNHIGSIGFAKTN